MTSTDLPDGRTLELLRRAAALGPGHRGRREPPDPEQIEALRQAFAELGLEPPSYFDAGTEWVVRRAKLFEAGEYPDKGVTVTAEALQKLDERFDLPVPVLIEHAKSPLELGFLTDVRREGEELYGTVAFSPEADALLRRSRASMLSLSLDPSLETIHEVSLVRRPRVPSARLLNARFHVELLRPEEARALHFAADAAEHEAEEYVRKGLLTPAQVPYAKALLQEVETLDFDGGDRPIQALVRAMIERSTPHTLLMQQAPDSPSPSPDLTPEEAEFYSRHFPDLSLNEIARRKRR